MTYIFALSVWNEGRRKYSTFFEGTLGEIDELQGLIRRQDKDERTVKFLLDAFAATDTLKALKKWYEGMEEYTDDLLDIARGQEADLFDCREDVLELAIALAKAGGEKWNLQQCINAIRGFAFSMGPSHTTDRILEILYEFRVLEATK